MEKDFQIEVLERLARIEAKLENGLLSKVEDLDNRARIIESKVGVGHQDNVLDLEKKISTLEVKIYTIIGILIAFEVVIKYIWR